MQNINKENKKTKVCIFSFFGYPLYNPHSSLPFGGAEVQLFIISKELAKKKNLSVNVITGTDTHKIRMEKFDRIKLFPWIYTRKSLINYIKGAINLFRALIKINPDVILQRSIGMPTPLILLYTILFRKKFIYSIASKKDVIKKGKKGIVGKLFQLSLNHVSFIVAQNADQINDLKQLKKSKLKNIKVIKNSFEINEVKHMDKKTILWVGRATEEKRPELFLKIAEDFPDQKFIMVCLKYKYSNNYMTYWNKIYETALKLTNLDFYEFIPFNKIDEYFIKAKVFVNTSLREGFPNTFIQALKYKTPILSLNVDPDNVLAKYKCGFSCNNDLELLKDNLKKIIENNILYETYANNALNYVREKHDIKKNIHQWINLISYLVNYH